jgi:hypothetical protein
MVLMILPEGWAVAPPAGSEVVRRAEGFPAAGRVRDALSGGCRSFLLGVEGVSSTAGWLVATDHLNLFGDSPLVGPNRDDLGPRFPSLRSVYIAPAGSWRTGIVCRVPDWRLATAAELSVLGADALVSGGVDEAVLAGHGGASVLLLVRCHAPGAWNGAGPPLDEAIKALEGGVAG